jgi:cation transport regulator
MPYKTIAELPGRVRDNLPKHAEEIYLAAFNSAWEQYDQPGERRSESDTREEVAHKVAWAAVKNEYEKDDKTGKWVKKKDD